jgi:hypothetical protein
MVQGDIRDEFHSTRRLNEDEAMKSPLHMSLNFFLLPPPYLSRLQVLGSPRASLALDALETITILRAQVRNLNCDLPRINDQGRIVMFTAKVAEPR